MLVVLPVLSADEYGCKNDKGDHRAHQDDLVSGAYFGFVHCLRRGCCLKENGGAGKARKRECLCGIGQGGTQQSQNETQSDHDGGAYEFFHKRFKYNMPKFLPILSIICTSLCFCSIMPTLLAGFSNAEEKS